MKTKDTILQKALEMFNEKGIEYTGVRELAGLLDMRVSNISYYFPSKDDLVAELAVELRALNNTLAEKPINTLKDYLEMNLQRQRHQYAYRCLFLSFVHLITQNPILARNYKQTEKQRMAEARGYIITLIENGYLHETQATENIDILVGHLSLISRFWLSEARVTFPGEKPEVVINRYNLLLCDVLERYATAKGKRDIKIYVETMDA